MPSSSTPKKIIAAADALRRDAAAIDFSAHVPWFYNPLDYAWEAHQQYLRKYACGTRRVLFLGMNPGPWGMTQTGVPFGEIEAVKNWLYIDAPISKPAREHPKRPIEGLGCGRSEVSGRRLWGLFAERFESAKAFMSEHFVANYCPLVFMEESARNITPDKLPASLRLPLEALCDQHLAQLIFILQPQWVVGVGAFAEKCASRVVAANAIENVQVGRILHPSPASPAANKDWNGTAVRQLEELGIW
ncbi:MAG: uracil-DNA glycosylase family protein [Aureliella sp.]